MGGWGVHSGILTTNVNQDFLGGGVCSANLERFKIRFSRKTEEGGGVRQSRKFPDYTVFFLLKTSLRNIGNYSIQQLFQKVSNKTF